MRVTKYVADVLYYLLFLLLGSFKIVWDAQEQQFFLACLGNN